MITTPLLETKYKAQKQLDEEAQHDVEKYIENSHRIVRAVAAKYGVTFNYGHVEAGKTEVVENTEERPISRSSERS